MRLRALSLGFRPRLARDVARSERIYLRAEWLAPARADLGPRPPNFFPALVQQADRIRRVSRAGGRDIAQGALGRRFGGFKIMGEKSSATKNLDFPPSGRDMDEFVAPHHPLELRCGLSGVNTCYIAIRNLVAD